MDNNAFDRIIKIYSSLSNRQKKLADFIISNIDKIIVYPINKLSKFANVSEPTIIRFARILGYKGYPQLKESLLNSLNKTAPPVKVVHEIKNSQNQEKSILDVVINEEIKSLREAALTLDMNILNMAVDKICTADKIFTYGGAAAGTITSYLGHKLMRFGFNIMNIQEGGRILFDRFPTMHKNDFVVIFKFARPTADFKNIMEYISDNQIPNILVTDLRNPDMLKHADMFLYIKRATYGLFQSMVCPLIIANAILLKVEERKAVQAVENVLKVKKLRSDLDG